MDGAARRRRRSRSWSSSCAGRSWGWRTGCAGRCGSWSWSSGRGRGWSCRWGRSRGGGRALLTILHQHHALAASQITPGVIVGGGDNRVIAVGPRLGRPREDPRRSRLVIDPVDIEVDFFGAGTDPGLDPDRPRNSGAGARRFDRHVACVGVVSQAQNYQAANNSEKSDSQPSPVPRPAHNKFALPERAQLSPDGGPNRDSSQPSDCETKLRRPSEIPTLAPRAERGLCHWRVARIIRQGGQARDSRRSPGPSTFTMSPREPSLSVRADPAAKCLRLYPRL